MGQTLTHGIYLPDEGERNCYDGLASNWSILDGAVGTVAEHTTALAGKAPAVHTHTKSDVTDLLNSNFIPSANNSYDLGSSSYQWNNLYAKSYYYNGTAWGLDKANEWSKTNKFSVNISPSDITGIDSNTMAFTALRSVIFFNTTGSSNRQSYGTFLYSGYTASSKPDNYGQLQLLRSTDKKGETNNGLIPDTSFAMWRVAPHYLLMDFMNAVRVTNDGNENSLKPITDNTTDLGTSDNRFKTLNGTNPGALSLPDYNNYLDVTSSIPVASLDGNTQININEYLADKTGWLSIVIDDTAGNSIMVTQGKSGGATAFNNSRTFHTGAQSNECISVFFPMIAGLSQKAFIKASSLIQMRFYYCLGNV